MYSYAFYELGDHHEAEDATERTFLAALTNLDRFEERARPADGEGASTFRVWLFRIARNVVANQRRGRRRHPQAPIEAAALVADPLDVEGERDDPRRGGRGVARRRAAAGRSPPGGRPALRRGDVDRGDRRRPRPLGGRRAGADPSGAADRRPRPRSRRRRSMTAFERDATEVEALLTDRYLESVLARAADRPRPGRRRDLDPALRIASDRLRRDLVRVHPSFRFEERLAARLAEAAAALADAAPRSAPRAASIPFVAPAPSRGDDDFDPLAFDDPTDERRELPRPLLIGGALTSAAISLAGRPSSPGAWPIPAAPRARWSGPPGPPVPRALAAAHVGRLD